MRSLYQFHGASDCVFSERELMCKGRFYAHSIAHRFSYKYYGPGIQILYQVIAMCDAVAHQLLLCEGANRLNARKWWNFFNISTFSSCRAFLQTPALNELRAADFQDPNVFLKWLVRSWRNNHQVKTDFALSPLPSPMTCFNWGTWI
jgi:hypothetical protein